VTWPAAGGEAAAAAPGCSSRDQGRHLWPLLQRPKPLGSRERECGDGVLSLACLHSLLTRDALCSRPRGHPGTQYCALSKSYPGCCGRAWSSAAVALVVCCVWTWRGLQWCACCALDARSGVAGSAWWEHRCGWVAPWACARRRGFGRGRGMRYYLDPLLLTSVRTTLGPSSEGPAGDTAVVCEEGPPQDIPIQIQPVKVVLAQGSTPGRIWEQAHSSKRSLWHFPAPPPVTPEPVSHLWV
jgi:hypothetical protein